MSQSTAKPLGITDVVLRDAHQSLLATRMRLDDMLPVAEKLDRVGFWSLESWGGATFDACIRYLGEDPWERIRALKQAMPNTPQQMLLRGQNILGYRHYADDVVIRFVERAAVNGVDVFRIFDAMNDVRNIETALKAVKAVERHAQGTLSYTVSPVHTLQTWIDMARRLEDMGADSLCIKDMAGLLRPYDGFELVAALKQAVAIPLHMQCHATTGLSTATYLKCIEAGVDNVDTAISSMSMTYGHSPTEALVAILEGSDRDTGLDIRLLEEIAGHFREVRKKYARFEGTLKGVDARILVAQVPGGMLTNLESQLREQNALDRFDEVLAEIPLVREDLGFIPLVTPTSQIVGTQAVLNVLAGARYQNLSSETVALLKGEYGATPAPVNKAMQDKVLRGEAAVTCRPADLLQPELGGLHAELRRLAAEKSLKLADGEGEIDDVLTYALFPQVGLNFLQNRGDARAFEPPPQASAATPVAGEALYTVTVEGVKYVVKVEEGGDISAIAPLAGGIAIGSQTNSAKPPSASAAGDPVAAPLGGKICEVLVAAGQSVQEGDVLLVMETMKMETAISARHAGVVSQVAVAVGDTVKSGDLLLTLAGKDS